MSKRTRHILVYTLLAIGSAFGAHYLSAVRFFQLLDLKLQDSHFVLRGRVPTANIILLTADQKALDSTSCISLPQDSPVAGRGGEKDDEACFSDPKMFWHPIYAEAIKAAGEAGAKVIGLDLAFGIPVTKWLPKHDQLLAEAVATSPVPVVCGYVASLNTNQATNPLPINIISAGLGLDGFANITTDQDDFVRRQELIEAPAATLDSTSLGRSLAMRVAEKYVGKEAEFHNGQLAFDGHPVPNV